MKKVLGLYLLNNQSYLVKTDIEATEKSVVNDRVTYTFVHPFKDCKVEGTVAKFIWDAASCVKTK